ncbi:hypothetical protein [Peribacillus simplex]|uniref:hypothetical protein n=1 Tax=Peribacillus simplex TaxID=1478 RepID=UPI003D2C70AA
MRVELQAMKKFKTAFRGDDYRFLVAKIAIYYLRSHVRNKTDLFNEVNKVLLSQKLAPISFGFIRNNI